LRTCMKDSVIEGGRGCAHTEITRGSERNQSMSESNGVHRRAEWRNAGAEWRSTERPQQPYLVWIGLVLLLLPVLTFAGVAEQLTEAAGLVQGRQYDQAERIYKSVLEQAIDQDQQLAAQTGLVLLYVKSGKDGLVTQTCERIIADFSSHKDVANVLGQVADECRNANRFSVAVPIYQSFLDHWPEDVNAVLQQANLVTCQICLKDENAADVAFKRLQDEYGNNPRFRYAVCTIGDNLRWRNVNPAMVRQMYTIAATGEPFPDILWAKMGLAILCVRLKDLDAAGPVVRNLVADFGNDSRISQAACHIADAYRDARRHSEALELYQYVIDKHPQDLYAMWSQAGIAVCAVDSRDEKALQEAVDRLGTNYACRPDFAAAVSVVADNCRWRDAHDKASHLYAAAIAADPNHPQGIWFQMGLAISSVSSGDPNTALAALTKLNTRYRDDPGLTQVLYEVGYAFSNAGLYDKAGQILNQVISIWPESEYALLSKAGLGLILVRQGDDQASDALYQKLLADHKAHPRLSEALLNLGDEYYNQAMAKKQRGDSNDAVNASLRKALVVWDRIITGLPESAYVPDAWYFSGVLYRRHLGDYEKAVQYYQKVVDQWPDYKYAWSAQGMIGPCYEKLRDVGKVPKLETDSRIEQAYEALVSRYPDCSMAQGAYLKLGRQYVAKGQWDRAVEVYGLYLNRYPQDKAWSKALIDLAVTYERMGRTTAAAELYRTYLGIVDSTSPRARIMQAKLDRLEGKKEEEQ
jgi:tetratricopeptide (TPR) repeat protein